MCIRDRPYFLFVVTFCGHFPVILTAKSKGSDEMKQILIVEDDSFLNKMLAYNLTADGYGVTSALNARTAAEAVSYTHLQQMHRCLILYRVSVLSLLLFRIKSKPFCSVGIQIKPIPILILDLSLIHI